MADSPQLAKWENTN